MSAEGRLGPKKLRQAEQAVGEPLLMAFVQHPIVECVTADDRHIMWDRSTGDVWPAPAPICHWTTCPIVVCGKPFPECVTGLDPTP